MASLKTYARKSILVFMAIALVLGLASFSGVKEAQAAEEGDVAAIVSGMSLDEKISQMIIPAIRSWNGANVTDLGAVPELASALQKHQYGGVILYGANVVDVEQTTRLVSALQANNSQMTASTNIPYFMPVDEEGGVVLRFSMGTRMNGNMAVGATGDAAVANAQTSGKILGEECAAMGFNVDFAPVVDVNNNPANPVIGIRSFSDDPARVAELGAAYANGLGASNVIGTYKHFPGHGNTSVDSHLGTPSVTSTYEELKAMELVPFQTLIEQGADMIMTAHITYPNVDDEVVFGDGVTRGNYPATMSEKMMNQILRKDMGFNGVIVTDALEMGALYENALVPGEADSAEYSVNIAEKVINAGVDILLLPKDLNAPDVVTFYDDYIAGIAQLVENGTITEQRIDESVTRILNLKQKYGILGMVASGADVDQKVAAAKQIVGSEAHHADEAAIAKQAITLVKNESTTLPFSGYDSNIVLLCRDQNENALIANALTQLQETGVVASDAYVNNLASGQTSGSQNSSTKITIDYYYDTATSEMHYTDELKSAIAEANAVACLSKMFNLASLQPDGAIYQSISTLIADTHAAGGKFALISGHLPYDIARYSDVEAMVLAYMSSGTAVDPTDRNVNTGAAGAYNANIAAAYKALFDDVAPTGALPVNVPAMVAADDGTVSYADTIQHERGTSLRYAYQFTEGMGASHEGGSTDTLTFKTNARNDKLVRVLVDGAEVDAAQYTAAWGPTRIVLSAELLNALEAGEHTLAAVYDYGSEVSTQTTFSTTAVPQDEPASDPEQPASSDPEQPASSDPASSDSGAQSSSGDKAASGTKSSAKAASSSASSKATSSSSKAKAASSSAAKTTTARTGDAVPASALLALAMIALAGAGAANRKRIER